MEFKCCGKKIQYYRKLNTLGYQGLYDSLMLYGIDIHKQSIYNIEIDVRTVVNYELFGFAKFSFLPI